MLGSRGAVGGFPGPPMGGDLGTGEDQWIMHQGHDLRPSLEWFRSAETRLLSQEILLVETGAVFLTEATGIPVPDPIEEHRGCSPPKKSTDALLPTGGRHMRPCDPYYRDLHLTGRLEM